MKATLPFNLKGRVLSGALHYFRVPKAYWPDRLEKLLLMGLNTVETYVPWNFHEPREGQFHFGDNADLESFLAIAHSLNLQVILRFSPYICAEWEFGGLPYWLLKYPDMALRCSDPVFLQKVDRYYDHLIPLILPHLNTQGGPIVAVQVENEYGSYGNDKIYLEHLVNSMVKRGIDVPLFTSDGPTDLMLTGGTLNHIFKTVNFGSKASLHAPLLARHQNKEAGPFLCMEFWNGWFDHWGESHHTRSAEDAASALQEILDQGPHAGVNFYMFHGGTNFGFYNGANYSDRYEPTTTSYDYDAPLNEWGGITEKYLRFQALLKDLDLCPLRKALRTLLQETHQLAPLQPPPTVNLDHAITGQVDLIQAVSTWPATHGGPRPLTMEALDQDYGYCLYQTTLPAFSGPLPLTFDGISDRAHIYVDDILVAILSRTDHQDHLQPFTTTITGKGEPQRLSVLVENMGRINYGPRLKDPKGLTGLVRLDYQHLFNWTMHSIPMDGACLKKLHDHSIPLEEMGSQFHLNPEHPKDLKHQDRPVLYSGTFTLPQSLDLMIDTRQWQRGILIINGHHLGRFWNIGPQEALYAPKPLLRPGENHILFLNMP